MHRFNPRLDRRQLLRNGTIAVSMGALVAACGDRSGPTAAGRLGVADEGPSEAEPDVNDIVLLRTAQSLEYTAMAVYDAASGLGVLSPAETDLVRRFVQDHERHAGQLGQLIDGLGGEQFTCENPFLRERAIDPILGALDGSDDLHRDVLNIAHSLESFAGASYQALVAQFENLGLRRAAMQIGGEEQRHSAALALAINPRPIVNPELTGGSADVQDNGMDLPYAIPSQFGLLTGIVLVVGPADDEGTRFNTTLQTPAANTLVYEHQSC